MQLFCKNNTVCTVRNQSFEQVQVEWKHTTFAWMTLFSFHFVNNFNTTILFNFYELFEYHTILIFFVTTLAIMFSPKSPLRKMFDLNIFHKKRIYSLNEGSIEDFGKINESKVLLE
jgi:hypothetical protein